jgi:hypothetical protein
VTTARRTTTIVFSGDVDGTQELFAAANASSPAVIELKVLEGADSVDPVVGGNTTIDVPAGATAVTILPPADNVKALRLKGVDGDTGIRLHDTDPTTIALDDGVTSFVLQVGNISDLTVRLYWS